MRNRICPVQSIKESVPVQVYPVLFSFFLLRLSNSQTKRMVVERTDFCYQPTIHANDLNAVESVAQKARLVERRRHNDG